ncbi:MAG: AtpZ/AtpI family protein [Desulfotomaculaceae bacterium]|nr:AtpZ/AtpI family protein [Desulfotomaculaceae bacterium]
MKKKIEKENHPEINKDKDKRSNQNQAFQTLGMASAISAEIAIMTVAGYYCGQFLDRKFDTGPWLMLAGVLIGLVMGFIAIFKTLQRFLGERK